MAVNLDFLYTTPNAAIEPTRTCSSTATTVTISVLTNARMMVPSAKASLWFSSVHCSGSPNGFLIISIEVLKELTIT